MVNGLTTTLRIYFDPDADADFNSSETMATLAEQAGHALDRAQPGFTWVDLKIDVYYYEGGIEDSPKHGKYQRGAGFYADLTIAS